ncbi:MAG: class I SAM-dependent methyltransferase [Krumholzibacteria bacterium]|nr:class I SAM-dependent methyltransferase [Candidatus Krumholzibacteria bacterium]
MDHLAHNRDAWNRKAKVGDRWTVPVGPDVIAAARRGDWSVLLTPTRPVPRPWFPADLSCDLLALAAGGGQQGPVLAAAGARVTVLDNSPAQLGRDREVAARDGLDLVTVAGDMADLGCFADASFDLVFHPVANCFVPDVQPVWRECFRVLRPGGALLAGMMNPAHYVFDWERADRDRVLEVRWSLPHADADHLDEADLAAARERGWPLEWSHTLEDLVGGQLAAGFVLVGFYEDRFGPQDQDLASAHMPTLLATRALKPEPR